MKLFINEVFNLKDSGTRIYASDARLEKLKEEMLLLTDMLIEYEKAPSDGLKHRIKILLDRKRAFAAFKRDYVRDNIVKYQDLLMFV